MIGLTENLSAVPRTSRGRWLLPLQTDDLKDTPAADPEALIEEARQRQRQRAQRRNVILSSMALLVIVGLVVGKLAQGGGATQGSTPPASPAPAQIRSVTYEKIVEQKIVPHLPTETKTIESWYTQGSYREVVTVSGGRRLELGSIRIRDKALGRERLDYLYDPSTKIIYRTGYVLIPAGSPRTPEQFFKQEILGLPGAHLAGTRTYKGRRISVVKSSTPYLRTTTYVDKHTYQVLLGVGLSTDLRTVQRGIAYKTLPATKNNLALASLWAMHPHAHTVLQAPPPIKELYREATFGP
jgi:hypothetical protein